MIDDNFLNAIRREAAVAVAQRQFKGTVVVTAYNAAKYAIKGILVPHGLETGWIKIGGDHIGSGFGNVAGPKVGSADKLDGDQFAVEFGFGDPNTLVATHRIPSRKDVVPQVQSGEVMSKAQQGQRVFLDQSGNTIIDLQSGSMVKLKQNKDIIVKVADGGTVYHGGDPDDGGTFDFVQTVSGPSSTVKAKIG